MLRRKQTQGIEEAHRYLHEYAYLRDGEETFDAIAIRWHKERLEKVRTDCIKAINYGNGKITALRTGPTGIFERFDAADARIVARLIKKRLAKVKRIIAETPAEPLQPQFVNPYWTGGSAHHAMIYVQRAVKRKQRIRAAHTSEKYPWKQATSESDDLLELELSFKQRVPHRNGWGREYLPTRVARHRHDDNRCWKNKKCHKQFQVHLE